MKKKSIMAFGLAALLTVGTCIPVMAAAPANQTKSTDITYEVSPKFTATIPATTTITDSEKKATVTLSDMLLEEGAKVKVTPSAASIDLTCKSTTLAVTVGDSVGVELDETTASHDFSLTPATAQKAGTYTGNLSFTVSYVAPVTP